MTGTIRTARPVTAARTGEVARGVLTLLLAAYLVWLVWLVLWKLHLPFIGRDDMRGVKLIPFVAGHGFGASSPAEVVANVLVFLPLGVYLGALAPAWSGWRVLGAAVGLSAALETVQFVTAVGSSDVTDVLANGAGALVGVALLALARRRLGPRSVVVVAAVGALATAVAALATAAMVLSFPSLPSA